MSESDTIRHYHDPEAVSCTLTEAEVERRSKWVSAELLPRLERVTERDDGFTFVFPFSDDTLAAVTKFVQLETRCCSFGSFDVSVSPPEPILLDFYGPDGSKALIEEGFVSNLPKDIPVGVGAADD